MRLEASIPIFVKHGGLCRFPETAKGYSNDNSLSGKGEHCVDSQFVV